MVRRSGPAIRTTHPKLILRSQLPQAGCEVAAAWFLGPRSTRRVTECHSAAYRHNARCALHGSLSTDARTQEDLQRISEANIRHGRQTKDKLAAQRHAAKVGRRVRGELKRIERRIVDAGLMPDE